jgi:hypothetical protein
MEVITYIIEWICQLIVEAIFMHIGMFVRWSCGRFRRSFAYYYKDREMAGAHTLIGVVAVTVLFVPVAVWLL